MRRPRRSILTGGVIIIVAAVIAVAVLNPRVEQKLFERSVAKHVSRSNANLLNDDALRVAIAGSSAPVPTKKRAKACVVVFAGSKFYVVDVGPESVKNLLLWQIPMSRVGGVLLTHFHSDHIGDLGELNLQTWAGGRPKPLDVYGGPGVEQVVDGFNQAYRQDQGYRTAHHTEKIVPAATWPMVAHPVVLDGPETPERSRTGLVLEDGPLRISALEVNHDPVVPAYAYRFDYEGRSVVVTGDTKYHPPLITGAQGADVLVSEAIARPMVEVLEKSLASAGNDRAAAIMHDVQDYHISPTEAAKIANAARVKLLVFYHLMPAPDAFLTRRLFAHGVNDVRKGNWAIAEDGSLYTLPLGSSEVQIGRVRY